jgi:hypothetical protein
MSETRLDIARTHHPSLPGTILKPGQTAQDAAINLARQGQVDRVAAIFGNNADAMMPKWEDAPVPANFMPPTAAPDAEPAIQAPVPDTETHNDVLAVRAEDGTIDLTFDMCMGGLTKVKDGDIINND